MSNLAMELGREYMDQFYKEAMFVHGDKIHVYKGHMDDSKIITASIGMEEGARWSSDSVPSDSIKSMGDFRWPKLGYRQFSNKLSQDKLVYYVTSTRSAMRGLKSQFLVYTPTPPLRCVPGVDTPKRFADSAQIVRTIFNPRFASYHEGLEALRAGTTIGFALNEDFAVSLPVTDTRNYMFDVLYKGAKVGGVDAEGTAILPIRLRKRHSVFNLFEGRINL